MEEDKSVKEYKTDAQDRKENDPDKRAGVRYDPELYEYIVNAYQRSRKHIQDRGIWDKAEKYSRMYENDPWQALGVTRAAHLSKMKVSIAFDVIETGLNVVTARLPMPDIQPKFNADYGPYLQIKEALSVAETPEEQETVQKQYDQLKEEASDYAQKLQQELVETWRSCKMQSKVRMGYREKGKTGIMVLKSVYNPAKQEIVNELCDLTTIFPCPNVSTVEKHQKEPFVFAPVMSLQEVQQVYDVDPDAIHEAALGELNKMNQYESTRSGFSAQIRAAVKGIKDKFNRKRGEYCLVLECYLPADAEKDFEEYVDEKYVEDENGDLKYDKDQEPVKEPVKAKRPRYKSGFKRVTVILNHRNWIIEEIDNPYQRPPFFETRNYEQAGDFFGISEIQNIEDLVMRLNISASNINDNLRYTGNPKLILPPDAREEGSDEDEDLVTNQIGGIIRTSVSGVAQYLNPPSIGFDVKWWISDFLKGWIDRITHLSDALRGFNQFSEDSGRKVRELRQAAMGSFQTKVDEQADFCADLYRHWAFIYQNLWQGAIIQKRDDDFGDSNFEEFEPGMGRELLLNITVSGQSILPDDPFSKWEEAMALFDRKLLDGTTPLIAPEQLVDMAPTIEDKARIKRYIAAEQERISLEAQFEQVYEQFKQLAEQAEMISAAGGHEEDELFQMLYGLIEQFPRLMTVPEFQQLPQRLRLALAVQLVGGSTLQNDGVKNEP